jgi:hypothetical protein
LCVAAEPLVDSETLLPLLHKKVIEERVNCVIQTSGTSLFTTVLPDPVVATAVNEVPTFCGLYGCQMISVLVQVVHDDCVVDKENKYEANTHTYGIISVLFMQLRRLQRLKFLGCCKNHSRN